MAGSGLLDRVAGAGSVVTDRNGHTLADPIGNLFMDRVAILPGHLDAGLVGQVGALLLD